MPVVCAPSGPVLLRVSRNSPNTSANPVNLWPTTTTTPPREQVHGVNYAAKRFIHSNEQSSRYFSFTVDDRDPRVRDDARLAGLDRARDQGIQALPGFAPREGFKLDDVIIRLDREESLEEASHADPAMARPQRVCSLSELPPNIRTTLGGVTVGSAHLWSNVCASATLSPKTGPILAHCRIARQQCKWISVVLIRSGNHVGYLPFRYRHVWWCDSWNCLFLV